MDRPTVILCGIGVKGWIIRASGVKNFVLKISKRNVGQWDYISAILTDIG